MHLTIKINMDNAAFSNDDGEDEPSGANGAEVARILRGIADKVEETTITTGMEFPVFDVNGNTVGFFKGASGTARLK